MWLLLTPLNSATAYRAQSRSNRSVLAASIYLGSPVFGGTGAVAAADLAGTNRLQDIVANLRVDQAWGAAQIAIAAHNNGTSYYGAGPGGTGLVEWNGHPEQ